MLTKAQAKYIQNLGHKKLRDDENAFVAEGPKLVTELLKYSSLQLHNIFAVEEFIIENKVEKDAILVSNQELERISFLTSPNQVLAIFKKPEFKTQTTYKGFISLMLDTIQDPGNMGAILRTADWFGISTIICSKSSADVFNPKVVQSTMGSIARVQVIYADLEEFIAQNEIPPIYATTLNGLPLNGIGKISEGIVLIGNESKGISDELIALSQHKLKIPGRGRAESLNAAVATGIVLSQLV